VQGRRVGLGSGALNECKPGKWGLAHVRWMNARQAGRWGRAWLQAYQPRHCCMQQRRFSYCHWVVPAAHGPPPALPTHVVDHFLVCVCPCAGERNILVATDVASRGLDIPGGPHALTLALPFPPACLPACLTA